MLTMGRELNPSPFRRRADALRVTLHFTVFPISIYFKTRMTTSISSEAFEKNRKLKNER